MKKLKVLLGMLVAFLPILVLGTIGTVLDGGTLLGGMLINLGYVLSILITGIMLKRQGSSWRDIGLVRPKSWLRTIVLVIGTVIALTAISLAILNIAQLIPGAAGINVSRYNPLQGNLPLLLLYILLAWTTITFGEEMMYRAFLITQLGEIFQGAKLRWVLALIFSSVIFGLIHFYQGPLGIVNTFIVGILFGAVYLRSERNLWITIIAHGLFNTLSFVLMFYGI